MMDREKIVELVARLRGRMAEATPVGWVADGEGYLGFISHEDPRNATLFRPGVNNPRSHEDALLVVDAINALPELLAVAEAFVAERSRT